MSQPKCEVCERVKCDCTVCHCGQPLWNCICTDEDINRRDGEESSVTNGWCNACNRATVGWCDHTE